MRRLSDVPWTSQRLPSSPSCRRWHTCGRRRAPRCKNIKFILNKLELCLPHSKRLCGHVSALCLAVGRDDPECAKQKNQQVLQHEVGGCDNMGIRKRPVNRRAASQRARWQPETNNQIPAFFCFDLPSSSPQDQWCWWSQRGSPHSRDQRSRPGSGKKVLYKIYLLHKFLCFCTIHHSIWPILYGEFLMLRRAITFLKNFLITLAIVLRE